METTMTFEMWEELKDSGRSDAIVKAKELAVRTTRTLEFTGDLIVFNQVITSAPNLDDPNLDDRVAKVAWAGRYIETVKTSSGRTKNFNSVYACHEVIRRLDVGIYNRMD